MNASQMRHRLAELDVTTQEAMLTMLQERKRHLERGGPDGDFISGRCEGILKYTAAILGITVKELRPMLVHVQADLSNVIDIQGRRR